MLQPGNCIVEIGVLHFPKLRIQHALITTLLCIAHFLRPKAVIRRPALSHLFLGKMTKMNRARSLAIQINNVINVTTGRSLERQLPSQNFKGDFAIRPNRRQLIGKLGK